MGRYPANKEPHTNVATIIPSSIYLKVKAIAATEDRTVAAVLRRMIVKAAEAYDISS